MKKKHLILVLMLIVSLWGASWYFIPKIYNSQPLEAGTFGDMFGAVNALFSGFAFAGLIYTIAVQRQELQEQKKAIEMQTEELSLQRKAIEMQNEELKMQREETARSADQLESQRNLMNLQLAMTTVNELIKIKNKRIEGIRLEQAEAQGVKALRALVAKNLTENYPITKEKPALQGFYSSFIYTLQYINNTDLEMGQKKLLANFQNIDSSDAEIFIIYKLSENDQEKLILLNMYDYDRRYGNIKQFILGENLVI